MAVSEAGELLGFVMVVGDEVEQVFVGPAGRGAGVAAVLLAEAERQVAAGGHDEAWLAVVAGNARARRFYEKCGWIDERRPAVRGHRGRADVDLAVPEIHGAGRTLAGTRQRRVPSYTSLMPVARGRADQGPRAVQVLEAVPPVDDGPRAGRAALVELRLEADDEPARRPRTRRP